MVAGVRLPRTFTASRFVDFPQRTVEAVRYDWNSQWSSHDSDA